MSFLQGQSQNSVMLVLSVVGVTLRMRCLVLVHTVHGKLGGVGGGIRELFLGTGKRTTDWEAPAKGSGQCLKHIEVQVRLYSPRAKDRLMLSRGEGLARDNFRETSEKTTCSQRKRILGFPFSSLSLIRAINH